MFSSGLQVCATSALFVAGAMSPNFGAATSNAYNLGPVLVRPLQFMRDCQVCRLKAAPARWVFPTRMPVQAPHPCLPFLRVWQMLLLAIMVLLLRATDAGLSCLDS